MAAEALNTIRKRIYILNVPVDVLDPEALEALVEVMLNEGGPHQISLITFWDIVRAHVDSEYREVLHQSSLVLPITPGIVTSAGFLHKKKPYRYLPFSFIISLLGVLEKKGKSVYLFGSSKGNIQRAALNLRDSFPGLKLVGRYTGQYGKQQEGNILLAIKKASPALLLAGKGVAGGDKWIYKKKKLVNSSILLWGDDFFEISAGKKNRIPKRSFEKGSFVVLQVLRNPLRWVRFPVYIILGFMLLIYKIRGL